MRKDNSQGYRLAPLLTAQFLGSLNDQSLKIIVALFAVDAGLLIETQGGHLALAGAIYAAPFLLFSHIAGRTADTFDKYKISLNLKLFELGIALACIAAFFYGQFEVLLVILFLMAAQSAFFSPVRQALLPEIVSTRKLTMANGYFEIAMFAAVIGGAVLGSAFYDANKLNPILLGLPLVLIASLGALASFWLVRANAGLQKANRRFREDEKPFAAIRHILCDRTLSPVVLGISYFWFGGTLLQLDLFILGRQTMHATGFEIGLMQAALGVGLAAGGAIAGSLCRRGVSLRFAPIGLILMSFGAFLLPLTLSSLPLIYILLACGGLGGAIFVVPLNAFLQENATIGERGRILAANNFLNMCAALLASLVLWLSLDRMQIKPEDLITLTGVGHFLVLCFLLIWRLAKP